jgi:tetratricopeptide (TPR) repeat protein
LPRWNRRCIRIAVYLHPIERLKVVARRLPADVGNRLNIGIIGRAGVSGGKMRFSVLLAGLATSFALSSPVLADSQGDLEQCKFVGEISKADQGIAACDRVILDSKVTGPARAAALSNRCGWWWAKKDADRALSDCNEAIKLDHASAPAYINRGNAYLSKADTEHAFGDFDEAIRLDPKSAWAHSARGDLYKAKGDFDHALADVNEAIQLNPGYALAYFFRADLYKRKGDFIRAMTDLNESIRLDPNDAKAYALRGRLSYIGGNNPDALADFDKAIRLAPDDASAYFNRGLAYFLVGNHIADAEADFKKANQLDSKDSYIALWLDLAKRRNGAPSQLAETTKQLDMTACPAPVIRQFLGELSAAQTIAAAADPDPKTQAAQTCEANFYSGELALLNKKSKPEGLRLLKLASKDCPLDYIESTAAIAELILNR